MYSSQTIEQLNVSILRTLPDLKPLKEVPETTKQANYQSFISFYIELV